ncbi:stage III sporulation protein SpoIIIAB [Clostridium taeniosporum]|uniref:Stage III sporulation protein SpoAB n=1 Tax=Clostridium taeniosporum TaxID=394958 RepID=A0A1D7XKQ5_9CLOT|nr:stage III sporulation protein SpoIIIAB [Clostridium taeniosporum]AOR23916.1 stage III sporulation protein SpoAB [Clostridium taeniosporum]
MLKLIFIFMLFLTTSYIGFSYGETFRKRYDELKEILKVLIILQNEILYGSTPLPEALSNIEKNTIKPLKTLIGNVNKKLYDGEADSVYSAFKSEYILLENDFYLLDSDKNFLKDFIKSLGESGLYGQEKIFNLVIENIRNNIKEAEEESKKNIKVYRYLGICIGAMITIFLI